LHIKSRLISIQTATNHANTQTVSVFQCKDISYSLKTKNLSHRTQWPKVTRVRSVETKAKTKAKATIFCLCLRGLSSDSRTVRGQSSKTPSRLNLS